MLIKIKVKYLPLLIVLTLFPATIVFAQVEEYAYTTAYFYVPTDVSFRVTLLGDPIPTESGVPSPGPLTPSWINFNASSKTHPWVQPRTNDTYAQQGSTSPIIQITNIGNSPSFDFYMNASVGGQGCIDVCANATLDAGSCGWYQPVCTPIDEQTSWVTIASDCSWNPAARLNITLYANFTNCGATVGYVTGAIYYRSSS